MSGRPCGSPASESIDLKADATGKATNRVLVVEWPVTGWMVVEAVSHDDVPFELALEYTGSDGVEIRVKLSIARAGRVCLRARTLKVFAVNKAAGKSNRVSVGVSEGVMTTRNFVEHGAAGTGASQDLAIPPFATSARLEVATEADLALSTIRAVDANGITRCELAGDNQPDEGIPVAGAGALQVTVPNTKHYRVVYHLAI